MRRLPVAAFVALVVATIAAFFVTQHLKVTTPLIQGDPGPYPAAISPDGTGCGGFHRIARFSFYLQHRADDVDVYVVDQAGDIVRTLALGRHMRIDVRNPDGDFPWNGRENNGSVAPDGTYYFRIDLIHQGRTFELSNRPITVIDTPPHPVVTDVTPSLIPQDGASVTIHYTGSANQFGTVRIYRTDLAGPPRLVKSFITQSPGRPTIWNGLINHRPAPQGTYLVGLYVRDKACNTGTFPSRLPPAGGATPHAGVTVRYLAAEPPLQPVPAGSRALVYVEALARPYRWSLQRAGARATVASGASRSRELSVGVPPKVAGLYELTIHSGPHRTTVPIVVSAARSARILVVLPSLTWQGQNPIDDDGDGIPDTLAAGGPIVLGRPLANGLPSGFADEASFLAHLDSSHLAYDLTTDLGLIDGTGPALSGHRGVVLAGSERWLPASLSSALRSYVHGGGRLLSLGVQSLQRSVTLTGREAIDPTPPQATDSLGARRGQLVTGNHKLVLVIRDELGILSGDSAGLGGYGSFEPIVSVAAPGQIVSAAGTSGASLSIVGYRLGRGIVVDIGLQGFGSSLGGNRAAQRLVSRLWSVLAG